MVVVQYSTVVQCRYEESEQENIISNYARSQTTIGWVAMKFCTDINGSQMMNLVIAWEVMQQC